jgi:hypothetical protein
MSESTEVCSNQEGVITPGNPCHISQDDVDTGLADWKFLLNFRPPSSVQDAVRARFTLVREPYQRIEDGCGPVNLDFYPVIIAKLPFNLTESGELDDAGPPMTPAEFLRYVRVHIHDFIDPKVTNFQPYDLTMDTVSWVLPFEDGLSRQMPTVFTIGMGNVHAGFFDHEEDRGSVVCSKRTPDATYVDAVHWIFSTLETLHDGEHPVSGNRQFGLGLLKKDQIEQDSFGEWRSHQFSSAYDGIFDQIGPVDDLVYFYTRGADRTSNLFHSQLADQVFAGAKACWQSLQHHIRDFVLARGGVASIPGSMDRRFAWDGDEIRQLWTNPPP